MSRIAVVPGALVLEPRYDSLVDSVPRLRAAVNTARAWADRVVVLNGTARRTTASPGQYDPWAVPFDEALFAALTTVDVEALRTLDQALAAELWADTQAAGELADLLDGATWRVGVDYDEAPTGVAWWAVRYENAARLG